MRSDFQVALYARVSTRDKGQNPELQLRELRDYCERRSWEIVGEYIDRGYSGAKESRPALDQLMKDAKRRKFDAIAVWKLDRFGRSLKHLVTALAELNAVGVQFVSLTDGFDLTTPAGRALFGMCSVMAEFERDLIRERVRAGMRNARRNGKRLGRPKGSLRPKIKVDVSDVRARIAAGESLRAIARSLKCSPSLLVKRLKN